LTIDDNFIALAFKPINSQSNAPSFLPIQNNVSLTYEAKYIPPELRTPEQKTLTHSIKVWIVAPPQTLSQIMKVAYYPQPPEAFINSNTTANSPADNFSVSWVVWGTFDLKAKVFFKDGQVKELSKYLSFSQEGDTIEMYKLHTGAS
jgi:transcription initiation factor IIF auxiliary subunit